jgi:hypothetical protein
MTGGTALRAASAPAAWAATSLAELGSEMCAHSPSSPSSPSPLLAPPLEEPPAAKPHISSAFSTIYRAQLWGADGEGSGTGSTLRATAGTRALVELLVWRHRVTRLLDAPCGSSHWWPPLLRRLRSAIPCFTYRGLDVVASVIVANAARYAGDPAVSFDVADLSAVPLPRGAHDMILCRDALQHIPLLDAIDVLQNFARAAPRILAVGSYLGEAGAGNGKAGSVHNREILVGEYFLVNLMLAPFNMTSPMDILDENTPVKDERERKSLLVYSGEYLATLDFDAMRDDAVRNFNAVARGGAPATRK